MHPDNIYRLSWNVFFFFILMTSAVACLQRFPDCGLTHNCISQDFLQTWQWFLQNGYSEDEMGWGEEAVPSRRCRFGQYPEPCEPGIHHLANFQAQGTCVDWPQQQCGKGSTCYCITLKKDRISNRDRRTIFLPNESNDLSFKDWREIQVGR